jgi:hypothetical protein
MMAATAVKNQIRLAADGQRCVAGRSGLGYGTTESGPNQATWMIGFQARCGRPRVLDGIVAKTMSRVDIPGTAAYRGQIGPHGLDRPRRSFAMGLMVVSSIVISFGGVVVRNIEDADSWQINLYRALALVVAIVLILLFQYRRRTVSSIRNIGRAGLLGGALLAVAGISFLPRSSRRALRVSFSRRGSGPRH